MRRLQFRSLVSLKLLIDFAAFLFIEESVVGRVEVTVRFQLMVDEETGAGGAERTFEIVFGFF